MRVLRGIEKDVLVVRDQTYEPAGDSPDEYVTKPTAELPSNDLHIEAFWLKKGMLKESPTSHASCFNCHWQEGGERPLSSDCAGCHKLLPPGQSAAAKPPAHTDADPTNPSAKGITDPNVFALELWSVVHGLASLVISKPMFDWPDVDALADHLLTATCTGLLGTPPFSVWQGT